MTALELMNQVEAERFVKMLHPDAYLECATGRIYATLDGSPFLMAGCADWKHALRSLATKKPQRNSFGVYTFWQA